MSYLPEGGYGLYSNFEDDDGFDFGDCQSPGDLDYEPVLTITKKPTNNNNINNGSATSDLATDKDVAAMDAPPPVSIASTIITDDDAESKQNGFIVGGDSPPPSDQVESKLLNFEIDAVKSSAATQPTTIKYKQSRFSPNLPHKPKMNNPRSRNPTGGDDPRSKYRKGCVLFDTDPQEQSRLMEQGEELRLAVTRGNLERVHTILDSGFNVNEQLSSGWTALLHACDTGREEMVEMLLERGADPNTHKDYYTALMAVCAHKSVTWREGLVSCARLLLNKGAKVNTYDRHQMSPLLYASQNGHLPLVELLLSAEADIHKQDSREWTALCLAASKGHLQVAQLLVSRGANPKAITYMGDSPFSLALDGSHTEVADWLDSITLSQGSEAPLAKTKEFIGTRTPQPAPSQEPLPSQCVQYGELELFLLGQQLGDLLPLFRQCKVQFSDLMSLTETDLDMMGVTQPSYRRKLMAAITEVHQRQWEMPKTSNLPYGRTISCTEASVILSHLTKHTNYIKATVRYLDNQVQANPDLLDVHTQSRDVKKLTNELAAAVEAVTSFSEEVKTIEIKINKLVPGTARPGGNKNKGRSRKTAAIKLAGTTAIIVFISYCGYRLWPQ